METIKITKTNQNQIICKTLKVLSSGGLVVFPTDTVYGLLADATNPKAIDKLLAFKERPPGKAISVFMTDEEMVSKYVIVNTNAKNIIKNLLPGPFTVVCKYIKGESEKWEMSREVRMRSELTNIFPTPTSHPRHTSHLSSTPKIDSRLPAENGTLGFRIPDYPLIGKLLIAYGLPLTATSANISSQPPNYSVETFIKTTRQCKGEASPPAFRGLGNPTPTKSKIDLIVDAGKLPYNKPSTVIDTTTGELKTLRFGDLLPATPNSLISRSEADTMKLAQFILSKETSKNIGRPIVFLLQGELGTGKTIFTKGLGKALGVKDLIVSPTFTICYEYRIFSTIIDHLSTEEPILNRQSFDTDRLDQNTNSLEHINKLGFGWEVGSGSRCEDEKCGKIKYNSPPTLTSRPTFHLSPSFLIHYDLYRIETPEDLKEIKFLESIKPGNIYSIEWPERIDKESLEALKKLARVIFIKIRHKNKKERIIEWS